ANHCNWFSGVRNHSASSKSLPISGKRKRRRRLRAIKNRQRGTSTRPVTREEEYVERMVPRATKCKSSNHAWGNPRPTSVSLSATHRQLEVPRRRVLPIVGGSPRWVKHRADGGA